MKRLFTLLLALCMLVSVGIFTVSAEEIDVFTKVGQDSGRAVAYTLQYSTLHDWDASTMPNYNCYAFAINDYSDKHQPGDFSGGIYDDDANVGALATLIEADLREGKNKQCIKTQSTCPTSMGIWSNIIAIRKDTTYDLGEIKNGQIEWVNDYHVAKFDGSKWLHKPGGSAVLEFNNAPSNSVWWWDEKYDGTYRQGGVSYDSDIIFMLYKSQHGTTTYKYTGQHYHSGTRHYYQYGDLCADCGKYTYTEWISTACSGPPCSTVMGITPTPEVS